MRQRVGQIVRQDERIRPLEGGTRLGRRRSVHIGHRHRVLHTDIAHARRRERRDALFPKGGYLAVQRLGDRRVDGRVDCHNLDVGFRGRAHQGRLQLRVGRQVDVDWDCAGNPHRDEHAQRNHEQ